MDVRFLSTFGAMKFTTSIIELIQERRSVRNYAVQGIEPELEARIVAILESYVEGPMKNKVCFQLLHSKSEVVDQKVKMGTYGFIKGAEYYIAGEIAPAKYAEEDYGYLLEKIMLHLLEKGLGTCWLGGTYKRSDLSQLMDTTEGMLIPAITPVGFPAKVMSKRERVIRKGAGSDKRKPREELFFKGTFEKPLGLEKDHPMYLPLEMIRIGPSASNKQAWRVVQEGSVYHLFLCRTPGYGTAFKSFEIQRLDMGIAMAHFELSCIALGVKGCWELQKHSIDLPEGTEYIVSWVPEMARNS